MTQTPLDVSEFLKAKSDQLNADNLIGGPITVQITGVKVPGGKEQPVVISISGGHMPYKPCLTMRRLLTLAWGTADGALWVGRWMTLYRDPTVPSPDGTRNAGGIRISALSHIDGPRTHNLTESRGRKKPWTVQPLTTPSQKGAPTADLNALLADAGLTVEDVDRWREKAKKPPLATLTDDERAKFAGWLGGNPKNLDAIRALIPSETSETAEREPGQDQE
jgi:hypothetical protein